MSSELKYYCDKCGEEIPVERADKTIIRLPYSSNLLMPKIHMPFDLCDKCEMELTEVISVYLGLGRAYPNHNINVTVKVGKG